MDYSLQFCVKMIKVKEKPDPEENPTSMGMCMHPSAAHVQGNYTFFTH